MVLLRQNVRNDCQGQKAGLRHDGRVALLNEGVVFHAPEALLGQHFGSAAIQRTIKCIANEGRHTGRRSIHVIAHILKKLARLRLNNPGLLLVAAVKSEIDKLRRMLLDELGLSLRSLHQIQAHRHDNLSLVLNENVVVNWLSA